MKEDIDRIVGLRNIGRELGGSGGLMKQRGTVQAPWWREITEQQRAEMGECWVKARQNRLQLEGKAGTGEGGGLLVFGRLPTTLETGYRHTSVRHTSLPYEPHESHNNRIYLFI